MAQPSSCPGRIFKGSAIAGTSWGRSKDPASGQGTPLLRAQSPNRGAYGRREGEGVKQGSCLCQLPCLPNFLCLVPSVLGV